MRAYELEESAVEELKNRLPKLKVHDYNTIDRLMNHISVKHKITGKKLHDMFVRKYGHTPDTWIKKITHKLSEEGVVEGVPGNMGREAFNKKQGKETNPYNKNREADKHKEWNAGHDHAAKDTHDATRFRKGVAEEWSQKYKDSINCSNPKGFSQKAHCAGKKKHNEDVSEGEVLPLKRPMNKVQHGKRTFPPTQRDVKEPEGNITPITQKKTKELSEGVEGPEDVQKIKDFIKWSYKTLNMQKPYPKITISKNTEVAQAGHHTGVHKGNEIWVYVGNRNMIDIFRTIFHELTHHRQMQLNMISDGDSYPGSPIEMLADMAAGKYIKIYGKNHPEMFQ